MPYKNIKKINPNKDNAGQQTTQSSPSTSKINNSGFSFQVGAGIDYFLYNELLQGAPLGNNAVRYSYSKIIPYVFSAKVKLELTFIPRYLGMNPNNWQIYYTWSRKSKEIDSPKVGAHSWGGLIAARSF